MFVNIEKLVQDLGTDSSIAPEEVEEINLPWDQDRADQALKAVEKYLECKNSKSFINYQGFINVLKKISAEQLEINFRESESRPTKIDADIQQIYIINLFLLAYAGKENDFDNIMSAESMTLLLFKTKVISVVIATILETEDRMDKSKKASSN